MEEPEGRVFDEDYVKNLRSEAAGYRKQLRELESTVENYKSLEGKITAMKVENELIRRGVKAEADWVHVPDGAEISKAIDAFVEKYPHLAAPQTQQEQQFQPEAPEIHDPIGKGSPKKAPQGIEKIFGGRTLDEIREDPDARKAVGRFYRQHLPNAPLDD